MKCLKNLLKTKEKIRDKDKEMEEASKELLNELNKIGELTNNNLDDKELENTKEEKCEEENSSTDMNLD